MHRRYYVFSMIKNEQQAGDPPAEVMGEQNQDEPTTESQDTETNKLD